MDRALSSLLFVLVGVIVIETTARKARLRTGSTNHINENKWVAGRFCWQEGFGAFSYAHSQLGAVSDYIRDQAKHQAHRTFRQQYVQFLKRFEIPHDERYIFKSPEEG